LPLSGVVILDLSKVLAGPLCTQYLADLGANVIKVEPTEGGDDTRAWPPLVAAGSEQDGAMFLSGNRNKKSLSLDLKAPAGRKIVKRLARSADIFIESFSTGVAARLGVDYRAIRRENPRIIYVSVSGYGRSGPLAHLPGYDAMLQAFSGMMALTGEEGSGPIRIGFSPLDQASALHAAIGALAALHRRSLTGTGAYLEVSLFETALGFLAYNAQIYWATGRLAKRAGSGFEFLCPYQAFDAADGFLMLGIANDNLWRKFCGISGLEAAAEDPRFASNMARVQNRAETVKLVADKIRTKTVDEWFALFAKAGVPAAPINSLEKVLEHPHTKARSLVLDYRHPGFGALKAIAQPIRLDHRAQKIRLPPPRLGQHSREILKAYGYRREEIEAFIVQGVVRSANG
jgi:formyl-CoA transferase